MHLDDSVGVSDTVLGKTVSDLQSNIAISQNSNGGTVGGTSKYVTGYTGYSNNVSLQSGNYLVAKVIEPDVDNVTVTVTGAGAVPSGNNDGVYVFRITDTSTDAITITASATGYDTVTKVYSLSDLELETPNPNEFTVSAAPGDATVFGKTVSDIQSNISIVDSTASAIDFNVTGSVSTITSWDAFPSESKVTGISSSYTKYYLALKVEPDNITGVDVTYTVNIESYSEDDDDEGEGSTGVIVPGAYAGNGIYVFNLVNFGDALVPYGMANIIEITASATGYESVTQKISCNSLFH